jgi:hypothetical protein
MTRAEFPFDRYNRFGVLKVNLPTIAAVLFLSRHVLTFLVLGIALSRSPGAGSAFGGMFEPIYMVADIPALLVFLAMLARHPKSGRVLRAVWRGGPLLLGASALIYLALAIPSIGAGHVRHGWVPGAMVAGTVIAAGYVLVSPYARALFRGFPAPEDEDDKTSRS